MNVMIRNRNSYIFLAMLIPCIILFVIAFFGSFFCLIKPCYGEEDRSLYIVLVEGESLAFSRDVAISSQETRFNPSSEAYDSQAKMMEEFHNQLLEITLDKGSYTKLHTFTHLATGFSVHTTPSQAERLRKSPRVKFVERDRGAKLMTTYTPEFLNIPKGVWTQQGVITTQSKSQNISGEGIVIGFVDTGINPFHPSFSNIDQKGLNRTLDRFSGACQTGPRFPATSCNGKIVSAQYFAAGARAVAHLNTSADFLSPFDAVGHGSHVASIAAGNSEVPVWVDGFFYGTASGMAPQARIAVYKAIYPTIGTLADVLAAIDQAVKDGVDILTLAVEPDEPPEGPLIFTNVFEIFTLHARRAGVFVVQAAGNKGPAPTSVVSFSPWAVGVGACRTDRTYPATLFLGNGHKVRGVGLSGPTLGNGMLKYKLVMAKDAVRIDGSFPRTPSYTEECQHPEALDPVAVAGSIVICNFSTGFYNQTSTVTAIIKTAQSLGFMGFVLVANPTYGDFIAETILLPMPGIIIPKTADEKIISQYYEEQTQRDKQGGVTRYGGKASIGEGRIASFEEQRPAVRRSSSRGPNIMDNQGKLVDVLKPDFVAPGEQIWAAWSPLSISEPLYEGENFAMMSGTSMAAPHIAGIAALIKQHNPTWSPSMIASAISTTATKYNSSGDAILAEGYDPSRLNVSTPFDIGAGLVNPTKALDPGLVFIPGEGEYVAFLCSLPNISRELIEAASGGSCNRSLSNPSDLNLPSVTITSLNGSQIVHRRVISVGTKQETYVCSPIPPVGVRVDVYPSWFTIAPSGYQDLEIKLNVTEAMHDFSFGEIIFTGSLDHIVRMPLSVLPVSVSPKIV